MLTEGGFILNNALASFDKSSLTVYKSGPTNSPSSVHSSPSEPPGSHSGISNIPDYGKVLEHHGDTGSLFDGTMVESSPGTKEENLGHSPQPTGFSRRVKRSEIFEPGPRATVWGSSVANNYIVGGKRPISLSTPIIAVERGLICGRRLILGLYYL